MTPKHSVLTNPNPERSLLANAALPRSHVSCVVPLLGMVLVCLAASPAEAASSLTNALTEYSGTSQDNYPNQPAFLDGSGLQASFVWNGGAGAWEKINFDSTGATFGSFHGGSDGRNYLRTVDTVFSPVAFTAYVTVNHTSRQAVFFGMGTGDLGSSKSPDVGTGNASVYMELQDGYNNASLRRLGGTPTAPINTEVSYTAMTTVTGLMRLRMVYDPVAKTATYAINYNPTSQNPADFVADQTFPAVDVSSIAPEWTAAEKSSIYFGGENSMTFSNFVVNAVVPSGGIDHFIVTASSPQTAGVPFNVTITAQDSNNNTANDSTTAVTVSAIGSLMEFDWNSDGTYGDNSGTLVNGVKTIKARDKKAETVSIVATGGIGTTPNPPEVTITPNVLSQLQIVAPGETAIPGTAAGKTGVPNSQIFNRAFNVTVNAADAYWNVVNSVYDAVDFTSTDSTATLPAPGSGFLIEGTNTFSVKLNTNGNFTLTATNTTTPSITNGTVAVTAVPLLASPGTWASFPIQYGQTPDPHWTNVPVACVISAQGTAAWDAKHIKVCNDATNIYFLVELWPDSATTLAAAPGVENYFWFDSDNNPATGYVSPDGTSVGAEDVLDAWEVWTTAVRQTLWWGMSANFSPNANCFGPGGNPNGGWPADHGLYYEYSMSLAATNTDGSLVFPTNSVTIGFSSRYGGVVAKVIPAFSYTFATNPPPVPANPEAVHVSGGSFSFGVTNSSGSYVVQVNNSLTNPSGWTPIYTNTAPFTFTDPTPVSAHSSRFYRTVSQ